MAYAVGPNTATQIKKIPRLNGINVNESEANYEDINKYKLKEKEKQDEHKSSKKL